MPALACPVGLHRAGIVAGYGMSETSPHLPRLQHVTITFPPGKEAKLRDFYLNVLGFKEKPVPDVAQPLGWIWFYTGTDGVELHCVPDTTQLPHDPTHHFCIDVEDLETSRRAIKNAGYEIREARPLPHRPRFFTLDPFRNLIEVVHVTGDYLS